MIFIETKLRGAYVVEPELHMDERGFFARTWCQREFSEHGLNPRLVQCSASFTRRKGTLRGMHYQAEPHQEAKCVRCIRGAIYDVAIDLRPASPTFKHWVALELTADNRRMLYIPEGMAHGFLTLEDDTEIAYMMSEIYALQCARGVRWNDPAFGVEWPFSVTVISERDASYPDFAQECVAEGKA